MDFAEQKAESIMLFLFLLSLEPLAKCRHRHQPAPAQVDRPVPRGIHWETKM